MIDPEEFAELEDDELAEGQEAESCGDFEVGGESYVVSYTAGRVKLYEQSNRPIMAMFAMNGGTLSLVELESLLAYGLRKEGGAFVNPRRGLAMAEKLIEQNGYFPVYEVVIDALGRDCDFLFRGM